MPASERTRRISRFSSSVVDQQSGYVYHIISIALTDGQETFRRMDPLSLLNEGIGLTVNVTKFIIQFNAVKDETGFVARQVQSVTRDVQEAEELYLGQKHHLSDGEQFRTEAVIRDTKRALNAIAKQVEPARRDKAEHGSVGVINRVDWILRRSSATQSCQAHLATIYISLQGRLSYLRMSRLAGSGPNLPSYEQAMAGSQPSGVEPDGIDVVYDGMS